MKKYIPILAAFAAASLSVAQLYPQGKTLPERVAFRLVQSHVQHEVGLSPRQIDAIQGIVSALQQKISGSGDAGRIERLEQSSSKEILLTLNPGQLARVRQLAIQEEGPFALRDQSVSREVGLTPAQKSSIEVIAKRTIGAIDALGAKVASEIDKLPRSAPEKKRQQIGNNYIKQSEAIESKGEAEVLALLSKAQKAKWTAIQGKPFRL
jgi:hypothetical protein